MAAKPVVAGVDGSPESVRAVEWAAREAVLRGTTLRLVAVASMPPRMRPNPATPDTVAGHIEQATNQALAAAASEASHDARDLPVDTQLLDGVAPAQALVDCGKDALMLVLGSRGAGGFSALVLGSVSRYAATHAPCPVVVVREETMAAHREVVVGRPGSGASPRPPSASRSRRPRCARPGWWPRTPGPGRRSAGHDERAGRGAARAGGAAGQLAGEVPGRHGQRRGHARPSGPGAVRRVGPGRPGCAGPARARRGVRTPGSARSPTRCSATRTARWFPSRAIKTGGQAVRPGPLPSPPLRARRRAPGGRSSR